MAITKQAIIELLGDRPIAYHPILAKVLGGVIEALFISQLLYWQDKGKLKEGWIFKKQREMEEETGLTRSNQETARRALKKLGILEEKRMGVPGQLHYRLDLGKLAELLDSYSVDAENRRNTESESDQIRSYQQSAKPDFRSQCGNPTMWKSHNAEIPQCGNPTMWKSHNVEIPQCGNPTMRKSHNVEIQQTTMLESSKLQCWNPANYNAGIQHCIPENTTQTIRDYIREGESKISLQSAKPDFRPPPDDYLSHILEQTQKPGRRAGIADPSQDNDQWLKYGNDLLAAYRDLTGLHADAQVGRPAILQLAQDPDFDLDRWKRSIKTCRLAGVNPRNIGCMIDTYHAGGDYAAMKGRYNGKNDRQRRKIGCEGEIFFDPYRNCPVQRDSVSGELIPVGKVP